MNYIDNLNWRYATKKFDPNKKLSEEQVSILKEAARLAPSSYGLQPYKFIDVKDPVVREKLKEKSWNQSQITDASNLFVIAIRTDIDEKFIEDHIKLISKERNQDINSFSGLKDLLSGFILGLNNENKEIWATKQAYLVLGLLTDLCANIHIDACPMEGFECEAYDEILDLRNKNLKSAVLLTVGYRDENDSYSQMKKVRHTAEDLWI